MKAFRSCKEDPEIYQKIKKTIDMRQVVEYYGIRVDDRGWCACPFHSDRHPSMKLFPDGKGYYCFVCGAGGDQITFASRYLGIRNSEAARELADVFHVPLTEPSTYREKREAALALQKHRNMARFVKRSKLYLGLYRGLLCDARRDPENPCFLEGIYRLEYVEYLLDCIEQCPEKLYENREAVKKFGEIERRVAGWPDQAGEIGAVSG